MLNSKFFSEISIIEPICVFLHAYLFRKMELENFLNVGEYKLFYRLLKYSENQDEPVLVFLHDSWGCVEMWENFPEKISELFGLNALIYDRRGYGKSSRFSDEIRTKRYLHEASDELIKVMNVMKIEKAILYGHSDGGTIALIAAATQPDRFQAIIVEGAHSFVEEKGKAAVRESRDKARTNSLLQSLRKYHGEKTAELFRRWHEAWLGDFFADWTIVPILKNIRCPVLAFRGENDPFDTIGQLHVLEKEITAPVIAKVIPDAAHTPRKENEEETMELIGHFLDKGLMRGKMC